MPTATGVCAEYELLTASMNGHGYLSPRSMERDERMRHIERTQRNDQILPIECIQYIRRIQQVKQTR